MNSRPEQISWTVEQTPRGFDVITFADSCGVPCSVQQSSKMDGSDRGMSAPGSSYLWVGVDDPQPKAMASQARALGVATTETTGWVPYPIPAEVVLSTRMHLDREQVRQLIAVLQGWLDSGRLDQTVSVVPD